MKNKAACLSGALVAFGISVSTVMAQGGHGAHTHGVGSMNVIQDGNVLAIEIVLPGADVVGFEHEAKQAQDVVAVRAALKTLRSPSQVLVLPASARCTTQQATSTSSLLHDDDDRAHAGTEAHHDGHGGFAAHYEFNCASPADVSDIGVNLFRVFPSLNAVNAVAVTEARQTAKTLTADDNTISLAQ